MNTLAKKATENFLVNICAVLTAYSVFGNKPETLQLHVEECKGQLELFAIICVLG